MLEDLLLGLMLMKQVMEEISNRNYLKFKEK
jgi:hypothetical protein